MWRRTIAYPLRVVALGVGLLSVAAVLVLGGVALRSLHRVERIQVRMEQAVRVRRLTSELLSALVDRHLGRPVDSTVLAQLSAEVETLPAGDERGALTASGVAQLRDLLQPTAAFTEERLTEGLRLAREITTTELTVQDRLFERARRDARVELELALVILAGLTSLSAIGWWVVRSKILKPLDNLRVLFTTLANGNFAEVSTGDVEPVLVPLFQHYNDLVTRLRTLEAEHRSRARSLEDDVRVATQTLLEQHRSLANAERLAVVGEMAAGVAHDLRNPLAGVSMSLENLRRDVTDPDVVERLDAIHAEIARVNRLLGQYLASARHEPEPLRTVDVRVLVADLLELVRYQAPPEITLTGHVSEGLTWPLPRDRIRQVLLNLVMNGVQALQRGGGNVVVEAYGDHGTLRITVSDDGPGFPPARLDARPRAFVSQRDSGTGLGLVMVQRFVDDLGGRLELRNLEPRGARVTLILPTTHG
jgi:two-component system NtrC family sensor kinase